MRPSRELAQRGGGPGQGLGLSEGMAVSVAALEE